MIHAYQEIYLAKAQSVLGDAFDYAINDCHIPGEIFIELFAISSISRRMENGEPSILSGKSGIELVIEIVMEAKGFLLEAEPRERVNRSCEYWIGWAVCYYQWCSGRSYSEIFTAISFSNLQRMYFMLHEANISKFVETADARVREHFKETNLKRIRQAYNYTQTELAKQSGVSLRSIQMYEQRNKDINKASADVLYRISKVLGCSMESLVEKGARQNTMMV